MIEFKLPRLRGVSCNICHKGNDVIEIAFRSDGGNSGHTLAICRDCRKTLAQLLKVCGGADGGETVCGSTEPVVHCCECEHWNLETEQPNSLPRQCECKMFSNSSVSQYTNENGFCYRGAKRQSMTTGDWLRSLTDEELVQYLDWLSLCPKHGEECDGINETCAKCITQELKKER